MSVKLISVERLGYFYSLLKDKFAGADAAQELSSALASKADSATTLEGYGITDAYTKAETDSAIAAVEVDLSEYYTKAETDEVALAYAPTATVVKTDGGTTITLTDKNGTTSAEISDGAAATVSVGTVGYGAEASVTNSGTDTDAVLDFIFPVDGVTVQLADYYTKAEVDELVGVSVATDCDVSAMVEAVFGSTSEGEDETVYDSDVATDEEVDEMLGDMFG